MRATYERIHAAAEDGDLDAIVTWHNDRLHRSPRRGSRTMMEREEFEWMSWSSCAGHGEAAGQDPNEATARPEVVVEGYQQ